MSLSSPSIESAGAAAGAGRAPIGDAVGVALAPGAALGSVAGGSLATGAAASASRARTALDRSSNAVTAGAISPSPTTFIGEGFGAEALFTVTTPPAATP